MEAVAIALIASVIGPGLLHVLNRRDLKARVGSRNGNGDLYAIAERTESKVDDVAKRITSVEGRTAGVETRLGHCEQDLGQIRQAVDRG